MSTPGPTPKADFIVTVIAFTISLGLVAGVAWLIWAVILSFGWR
jgi:hypothetical protein